MPENIPHLSSPSLNHSNNGNGSVSNGQQHGSQSGSPVKEQSFLHRETSIDEQEGNLNAGMEEDAISPPPQKEGVPIRWQN